MYTKCAGKNSLLKVSFGTLFFSKVYESLFIACLAATAYVSRGSKAVYLQIYLAVYLQFYFGIATKQLIRLDLERAQYFLARKYMASTVE